jgi:hypothetical protein
MSSHAYEIALSWADDLGVYLKKTVGVHHDQNHTILDDLSYLLLGRSGARLSCRRKSTAYPDQRDKSGGLLRWKNLCFILFRT